MLYLFVERGGVEPLCGCPTLFAFAYSNFPATATVPLLRSFPPSSEAGPADYPVRWLTIQCSTQGLRVILQSFYLVYIRSYATSVAGHQPSYQSRHITFWCCKYDAVLFCVAETNTIHYQNHCHLVLHALRLPLLYFCIVHIL